MSCLGSARRCALGLLLCLCLTGCFPSGDGQLDEKKEPNFINGKNLVGQMDFQGAIDAYEKALEVNPHSASAHFELGWLYEEKVNDPAAAIYHYDRYLKFSSNPGNADVVRQRINNCKMELVKGVSAVGTATSPALREMDRIVAQNKDLQTQVADLQAQLAQAKTVVATRVQPVAPPAPVTHRQTESPRSEAQHPVAESARAPAAYHSTSNSKSRTHTIKSRETMASIARIYGVSVNALQAANPQVRPTHLIIGQNLIIP